MAWETERERRERLKREGRCLACLRRNDRPSGSPCSACAAKLEQTIVDSLVPCFRCGKPEAIARDEPCPGCRLVVYAERCDAFMAYQDPWQDPGDGSLTICGRWQARPECRSCQNLEVAGSGLWRKGYRLSCRALGVDKTYTPGY